jgi:hypothetical protein
MRLGAGGQSLVPASVSGPQGPFSTGRERGRKAGVGRVGSGVRHCAWVLLNGAKMPSGPHLGRIRGIRGVLWFVLYALIRRLLPVLLGGGDRGLEVETTVCESACIPWG